jgi:ATP-dependent Clp protease ATP-binding subunit ClpC
LFQNYIQKSTQKVLQILDSAVSEMVAQRQRLLSPDFVLLALITQPDTEAVRILENLLGDHRTAIGDLIERIHRHYEGAPAEREPNGQVVASQEMVEVLRLAEEESRALGDAFIGTGALFIALFDNRAGLTAALLREMGITRDQARKALKEIRGGRTLAAQDAETRADPLAQYTLDLTELARQGKLDPVIGREEEIAQVIQILARRKKNNPVLIGEAGVGKTVKIGRAHV